ncbi:hypothetical protein CDEST_01597 [Colletotrichum destructivum]|uniref:DUF7708 domain-containing protein n=1 Tax=Colletotrichum destructivum TaxID=34406 RepID=A0AAX4I0Q0_9PEZI|nr:hypothetical protein CDEST_01597 [Colletotrichum destructivum]
MADRATIDLAAWHSVTPDSTIFQNALREFSFELSNDPEKLKWIVESKYGNIEAVLASVEDARQQYKGRKGNSKAAEALTRLSEKIHHYGGIVDVVVSHHPEYTALVWGAMKFFFVGVVNHQKVITRLSEGLVQIADLIPTADLTLRLYPLPHVRKIVIAIHANILKFLVRALRWYQESKFMHVVHAITRPTELRYDDILFTISALSRSMSDAALASSQAEQRDMHLGILQQSQAQEALQSSVDGHGTMLRQIATAVADARGEQSDALAGLQQLIQGVQGSVRECLTTIMLEITADRINTQVIHESANVHLRHQLSKTQVAAALNVIAVSQLPDPMKAYQTSIFLANMRRARPSTRGPPFWLQDEIQQWNAAIASSLVVVNGTKKMRFHLQWFCAQSIAVLRESGIAVVWALNTPVTEMEDTTPDRMLSSIDMIKYLVSQVIMMNKTIHNEEALVSRLKSSADARSEEAWIVLLAAALRGLPHLYVVLDADIMSQASRGISDGGWPAVFFSLFAKLLDRDAETVVKVILVSSGLSLLRGSFNENCKGAVVAVGRGRQPQTVLTRLSRRGGGAESPANVDGLNLPPSFPTAWFLIAKGWGGDLRVRRADSVERVKQKVENADVPS